jgi:SAM-dependent methyltransferase
MAESAARRIGGFTPPREIIFRRALAATLAGCRSVLDVGCGARSPLGAVGFSGFAVGLDASGPALAAARAYGRHAALVRADAATVDRVFRPASFDAVVALDVIEHLERERALALVAALERVARRRVVIFTPNGYVPQPPTPENPYQEHRCGFDADDMRALGYRVRGIHGLGCLCGPFGESRWSPGAFWRRVSDLTAPLVYRVPRLAFALLCVKDMEPR